MYRSIAKIARRGQFARLAAAATPLMIGYHAHTYAQPVHCESALMPPVAAILAAPASHAHTLGKKNTQ
jgi:hypothetical protein